VSSLETLVLHGERSFEHHLLPLPHTGTPRKPETPELEAGRERHKILEDEIGIRRAASISRAHTQSEVEGTIERWGSLDIVVGSVVTRGVGAAWNAADLQIPKVPKLTNEINDLFTISPRKFQL